MDREIVGIRHWTCLLGARRGKIVAHQESDQGVGHRILVRLAIIERELVAADGETLPRTDKSLLEVVRKMVGTLHLAFGGLLLLVLPLAIIVSRIALFARSTVRHRWFLVGVIGVVGVFALNATAIDMRFFSFVPAMVWMFLGLGRRAMLAEET